MRWAFIAFGVFVASLMGLVTVAINHSERERLEAITHCQKPDVNGWWEIQEMSGCGQRIEEIDAMVFYDGSVCFWVGGRGSHGRGDTRGTLLCHRDPLIKPREHHVETR